MEEPWGNFPIRDQDGGTPRCLDLLQAWGPPLRPALRVRAARLLIRIANWLEAPPPATRFPSFRSPQGEPGPGGAHGSLSC